MKRMIWNGEELVEVDDGRAVRSLSDFPEDSCMRARMEAGADERLQLLGLGLGDGRRRTEDGRQKTENGGRMVQLDFVSRRIYG